MREILILTGCQGFIGMNFLERIKDEKEWLSSFDEIISVEKGQLGEWNRDRYFELSQEIEFKDVDDIDVIFDAMFTVVNFASNTNIEESVETPADFFQSNVSSVTDLVGALGVDRIKKFYHMRSYKESDFTLENIYSSSKSSQHEFLRSLNEVFGMRLHEFVLTSQYGKYQHPSKFIPKCFMSLVDGDKIEVVGGGNNMREWCFVEDTVDHIFNFIEEDETKTSSVVLNQEGAMSDSELIQMILDQYFESSSVNVQDHIYFTEGLCNSYVDSGISVTHTVNTSLEEGLLKTKEFYI